MPKIRALMGGLLLWGVLASAAMGAETYRLDPVHSFVVFRIEHLNAAHAWGRFNEPTGAFVYDEDPSNMSVEIEIQAEKVDTGNQRRDDHLRSPDFFNVRQFPTITFTSSEVEQTSEGEYEVTGELTIHGVTREITLPVKQVGAGEGPRGRFLRGYDATFTINRSDYGITFMPDGLGDEVTLFVSLEGIRQ